MPEEKVFRGVCKDSPLLLALEMNEMMIEGREPKIEAVFEWGKKACALVLVKQLEDED